MGKDGKDNINIYWERRNAINNSNEYLVFTILHFGKF